MTDITPEFKKQAEQLAQDLFVAAESGRVTHKKPKKAKDIIARYKELHDWDLAEVDVRLMVNYLRQEGIQIGSTTTGYFYMLDDEGRDHFANSLESRIVEITKAYAGVFPDRVDGFLFRLQAQAKNPKQELMRL